MVKRVLDVGQCGFDHQSIKVLIESLGARVERAIGASDAMRLLKAAKFDLVLVNRICEDGTSGFDLIERIVHEEHGGVPVMLVSNYPDSQGQAIKLGALPGFGKKYLADPATRTMLRDILYPNLVQDGLDRGSADAAPLLSSSGSARKAV